MPKPLTKEDVLDKIAAAGDCWMWVGYYDRKGYGRVKWGKRQQAHRVVWELIKGKPIPDGLTADHLCRNHWCVNPDHIEPVTNRENILRGFGRGALFARMKTCSKGHEFIYEGKLKRRRRCRICCNEAVRKRRLRRKVSL